jgi:flagellar assembly factor FliW
MIVQTSRFGAVEVDQERVITFSRGILGFPKYKNYILIHPEETAAGGSEATFYWLQSLDVADLAFVVTDPLLFIPDYQIPLREESRAELGLADLSEANVLVIVNKVGDTLTANLQGPLVIHATTRAAAQIVISEKKYQTRHPIMQLQRTAAVGTTKAASAGQAQQYVSKSA